MHIIKTLQNASCLSNCMLYSRCVDVHTKHGYNYNNVGEKTIMWKWKRYWNKYYDDDFWSKISVKYKPCSFGETVEVLVVVRGVVSLTFLLAAGGVAGTRLLPALTGVPPGSLSMLTLGTLFWGRIGVRCWLLRCGVFWFWGVGIWAGVLTGDSCWAGVVEYFRCCGICWAVGVRGVFLKERGGGGLLGVLMTCGVWFSWSGYSSFCTFISDTCVGVYI